MKKNGQAMVEYLILVALVAIASMSIVQILSKNLRTRLVKVSDTLAGESGKRNLKGTVAGEEHYKIRDLGDFDDAIEDSSRED